MELHFFVVLLWMVCFSPLILSPTSMVSSTSGEGSQTLPPLFGNSSNLNSYDEEGLLELSSSDKECERDSNCYTDNYHCFMNKCLCQPGWFTTLNDQTCTVACNASDLVDTFVEYQESVLHGYYLHVRDGLVLQDCKDLCLNTSGCLAFSFRAKGGRCLPHEATALEDLSLWCPTSSEGWSHFQRMCSKKGGSTRNTSMDYTWTVFQRRINGSVDFYKNWTEYETGFGEVNGEFWLGLSKLHNITKTRPHMLRIELRDLNTDRNADRNGGRYYAEYSSFKVGGPDTNYRLTVSGYSGTAGDSLSYHNNMPFSTYDREHDKHLLENCAKLRHGAWWYRRCYKSNLNGRYNTSGANATDGIAWLGVNNDFRSFIFTEMKLKPA